MIVRPIILSIILGAMVGMIPGPGATWVIGEDDRKRISENAEKIEFSKEEIKQALQCTGHIYCPGDKSWDSRAYLSAGAVCEPGSRTSGGDCVAHRILTAAHGFVLRNGDALRPGLDRCTFSNYTGFESRFRKVC